MVPTLARTLGVKGERPVVGSRDCKDKVYAFGALDLVTGRLVSRLVPSAARVRRRDGSNKTRRLQALFARHIAEIARAYPAHRYPRVVVIIDNAPWHRGAALTAVLAQNPHLELYRLPPYSPDLNIIERLWRLLRLRATHNRLFDHVLALRDALRRAIRRLQRRKRKLLPLIGTCRWRPTSLAA
jgi:transposase